MKYLALCLLTALILIAGLNGPISGQVPAGPGMDEFDSLGHTPVPRNPPAAAGAKTSGAKSNAPLTASLAKDDKGKKPATVFSSTDPKIFLVWEDDSAAKGDKLRFVWYMEGGASKSKKLTESTSTLPGPGAYSATYIVMPVGGFPVGSYRAEVYNGAKLAKSLPFTVKK